MKKVLKSLWNIIFGLIVALLVIYIIGMRFFPDQLKSLTGYQTFVVLTDSMEPTIPVGSLVLDKTIKENQDILPDTIISFHVNRLGSDAVFTHYFKKKEVDETGKERYYTQAENADRYDDYTTYREDILGTYVFHIPYAGKFVRFLQSPFAILELGIIMIISIIYRVLWMKFDEEEKAAAVLKIENSLQEEIASASENTDDSEEQEP